MLQFEDDVNGYPEQYDYSNDYSSGNNYDYGGGGGNVDFNAGKSFPKNLNEVKNAS